MTTRAYLEHALDLAIDRQASDQEIAQLVRALDAWHELHARISSVIEQWQSRYWASASSTLLADALTDALTETEEAPT